MAGTVHRLLSTSLVIILIGPESVQARERTLSRFSRKSSWDDWLDGHWSNWDSLWDNWETSWTNWDAAWTNWDTSWTDWDNWDTWSDFARTRNIIIGCVFGIIAFLILIGVIIAVVCVVQQRRRVRNRRSRGNLTAAAPQHVAPPGAYPQYAGGPISYPPQTIASYPQQGMTPGTYAPQSIPPGSYPQYMPPGGNQQQMAPPYSQNPLPDTDANSQGQVNAGYSSPPQENAVGKPLTTEQGQPGVTPKDTMSTGQ